MSKVDSRIVTMKFDNAQFEKGVATSMATMDKLKKSMTFDNAKKGLTNLQDGINKVNFSHMEGGITGISNKFMAMSAVGLTALTNITNKLVNMGVDMAKSLTIDPIKAGFDEYELKLGSIQTILANTQKYGTTLGDVTSSLDELNTYADKTIYNFGDMTKNIGLFTNAGIKIEDATSMIKGFSNSAAASGTSAEGAAGAAYQLSQALSSGKVTLMDWKSLTNVGMGNKNMQQGIIDIASAMGTFKGKGIGAKDAQANFNSTLEKGWLTADVMSNYLKIMAGDMDDAQMAAMGLSQAQIDTFKLQQSTAEDAATKVRTFTQLIGTMREAVGSGWSQTFETVIGNFDEATELWTNVNNAVGDFIQKSAEARNKVLGDWKALGGRTMLIAGIKNIFVALGNVIKPIRDAFREIFPKKTGEELFRLTAKFTGFTNKLKLSEEGMANLKKTFKGIFSILSIFTTIIKAVLGLFGKLLGAFTGLGEKAGGGILAFTGSLGEAATKIADFIKNSGIITKIFDTIAKVLVPLISLGARVRTMIFGIFSGGIDQAVAKFQEAFNGIQPVLDFLWEMFRKFNNFVLTTFPGIAGIFGWKDDAEGAAGAIGAVNSAMTTTPTALGKVQTAFESMVSAFEKVDFSALFETIWTNIKKGFGVIKDKILEFLGGLGVQEGLALINTGFFIMLYRSMKKFTDKLGGIVESASGVLDQVTANLKTMQQDVKSNIILKIAIAVALLAAALWVLSTIDPVKIGIGVATIAALMKILTGALTKFEVAVSSMSTKHIAKMNALAVAMVIFAAALILLALAVKVLGNMDLMELAKGVVALKVIMIILSDAADQFQKAGKDLLLASTALLVLSGALIVLAGAFKIWDMLDPKTIFDALWKIALALGVLVIALRVVAKPDVLAGAAGLFVVSAALLVLSLALKSFASMSGGDIVKAIMTMAAALAILTISLMLLAGPEIVAGATALLIASAALILLGVALKLLGSLSMGELAMAIGALVAVFVVLGIAAVVLGPVSLVILALAYAIGILGLAVFAIGAGLLLFSMGIAALVVSGSAGVAALTAMIIGIAMLFPLIMQQIGLGIVAFAVVIRDSAPIFAEAFTAVINGALQVLIDSLPKFGEFMMALIETLLAVLVEEIPNIVAAGQEITIKLLEGLADKIPEFAEAATDVIVAFLNAIGNRENIDRIIDAGGAMIVNILEGLNAGIKKWAPEIKRAGADLAETLIAGLLDALPLGPAGELAKKALGIGQTMVDGTSEALDAHSPSREFMKIGQMITAGLILGISQNSAYVEDAAADLGDNAIKSLKMTMQNIADTISSDIDINPTITPILDLSKVEKDAANITSMLNANAIGASVSYNQAATISQQNAAFQKAFTPEVSTPSSVVQFEQNNYSPKALSPVEIYRQTRNQLALAKEALKV